MSKRIIQTQELTKRYRGGLLAVDRVSFYVTEGEIFGLLGPNGAGKSTTIHMLITLLKPTAGRAEVCGYDVSKSPDAVRRCIGYVSQDIAVDESLTGRENLELQGRFYHLPKDVLESRTAELLEMLELTERANDLVSTYSGGMRKRLDITEGLIHRPRILFLDEPTLGLDIQTRRRIWDYIEDLRSKHGITVFLTTHYMEEADHLCDRVAIIDEGRIVALGSPAELKAQIGGDLVRLKLGGRDGLPEEELRRELSSLAPVERVVADGAETYTLVVRDGERALPGIFSRLIDLGVSIESVNMKRPTLDDVFLHYTGKELRDKEGSGAYYRASAAIRRARR